MRRIELNCVRMSQKLWDEPTVQEYKCGYQQGRETMQAGLYIDVKFMVKYV